MVAYEEGQRVFGESHERELSRKHDALPKDIEWHFIGHLQTNKVRFIVPYISLIEAVDSLRLFREIEKQAERYNKVVDCLLELHIAEEATKYGFTLDECRSFLAEGEWRNMSHVRIRGLMMMASFVDDEEQIRKEMMLAAQFFNEVKQDFFADDDSFCLRSWGMSDDYPIAIECNSNMIRVGTRIFGPRKY
jgi:pyridoxal phosphate enzyme (YggS family)